MNNKIRKAIDEFKALQSREKNPVGSFDSAGRWYPDESEKCEFCDSTRSPSRSYPYSLLLHCRTLKHICSKYELDYSEVKKAMNAEKPQKKVEKQIMYKKVAYVNGELQSVFSGEVYIPEKTYCEKVQDNHRGGYYAYETIENAVNAEFPEDSCNTSAEKIVVKVEMWGRSIKYGNKKTAYTYMKIVNLPPESNT